MSAKRSNEAPVWLLFGAGGFIAAFLLPVHIFIYGIAIPLGWLHDPGYAATLALLQHPLTRIYLGFLLFFCFFHAAHRIRTTFIDVFDMRKLNPLLAGICYGSAIAGSIITILLMAYN